MADNKDEKDQVEEKEPVQTVGEPPRDEKGQRTDVPLPENSAPNLPNPSNDPNFTAQPSGTYIPDNPQNFVNPHAGETEEEKYPENAVDNPDKKKESKK